jgi:hypothetical protein
LLIEPLEALPLDHPLRTKVEPEKRPEERLDQRPAEKLLPEEKFAWPPAKPSPLFWFVLAAWVSTQVMSIANAAAAIPRTTLQVMSTSRMGNPNSRAFVFFPVGGFMRAATIDFSKMRRRTKRKQKQRVIAGKRLRGRENRLILSGSGQILERSTSPHRFGCLTRWAAGFCRPSFRR